MSHKGTIITTDLGRSFDIEGSDCLIIGIGGAMYPQYVCSTCARSWSPFTSKDLVEDWAFECTPRCVHCDRREEDHVEGRCLFGPTKYERIVYEVKYVP